MKPAVIVHVPRRFALNEWGGTESVIAHLCQEQRNAGFQPEIHTSQALAKKPHEVWRDIPIHRYRYTYPFTGLSHEEKQALDKKGGNLLSFSLFARLLRLRNVRLFHAHVTKRMGATVGTVARLKKKPLVVTLHGNMFDVPKAEADSLVAAQKGHFEWGRPFGLLLGSRHLLQRADAVICVGHSEFEAARKHLSHQRIYHLPNGVDPDALAGGDRIAARKQLGIAEDDFCFGCISRLDPQKNQSLLVEAFEHLSLQHKQAHLILCGPTTNPRYAELIKRQIEESPAKQQIHLLPAVEAESQEHRDLLAALDCFVLPSRHEPFGIVILEAWAAKKPVIAADVGGLQRLVDHERNGLKFAPDSTEALTSCMLRMIRDVRLRESAAEAGRQEVHSHYTWKQIGELQENIYQQAEAHIRA